MHPLASLILLRRTENERIDPIFFTFKILIIDFYSDSSQCKKLIITDSPMSRYSNLTPNAY